MVLSDFDKELLASNVVGANSLEALYNKEKVLTSAKMVALKEMPIVGQLDYQHLKKIHHFLFENVYSWAGQDRYEANITATFGKGTTYFTPAVKNVDVLVRIFCTPRAFLLLCSRHIYFFSLGSIAFLGERVSFVTVTLLCIPTEDGWERGETVGPHYQ